MESERNFEIHVDLKFKIHFEVINKIKYLIHKTMTIETKWPTESAANQIAFNLRSLMLTNVKGAFNKFDASVISKYLAIASINFKEIKKG